MKFARGSLSWILTPLLMSIFFAILSLFLKELPGSIFWFISMVLFLITIILLVFFRDPERVIGNEVVAPADGKIREISKINDEEIGECTKISTFMNLHNVHVNRMPLDGIIKDVVHIDGAHLPTFKKESERNERVIITANTNIGMIKIVQIAGTLARRIIPYVKKGDKIKKGDRIGLIRIGSRVDLYLPGNKIKNINVKLNDRVKAGAGKIAEING